MQPKLAELDKSLPAVELVRRINELISHEKKSKYTQQWQRYYERVSQKEEDEQIRTEPFFAPEVLLYHMGYRPWMDAGAGIHVSIGVLGTFIGLSAGLSRLNVMDPEALRVGIEGLVSGMKIAFYTSVLGVFLSIVWILIDRMISKWLESHIDWHAERLDYLLNIDDEELFLNRLEKVSRSQADHLKTLLTDALDQAMRPVVHVLEAQLEQQKQNSQSMTEQLVAQVAGGTQQTVAQYVQVMQQTSQITIRIYANDGKGCGTAQHLGGKIGGCYGSNKPVICTVSTDQPRNRKDARTLSTGFPNDESNGLTPADWTHAPDIALLRSLATAFALI